ncbi:3-hydroxyacyl-CoA dehydrogenase [Afifella sp. IM 167]|uniref:3-hydroxyacyl-CoA dehydrogenase n=1 Tax=Afifella sp. IM 167 TaxID=2033586 RepID=UPI001CCE15AD|nr:3-hydroxyacyl-CoA dehydrogenase [Afifella sp. IM 167]MBZ8135135.1 3-hydroxyacyl-CoA dehydrogenase [Afifella sp. IM 167]
MSRIAVVGCGVVGSSWALVFARAGLDVVVHDPSPQAAAAVPEFVRASAASLAAQGLGSEEDVAAMVGRITVAESLAEALKGADYIQESAPERIEIKRALYTELDALAAPEVVIGSSTSGLPASDFTENLAHRERCLVVHPVNPPHIIPLVELVPAPWTAPEALAAAKQMMQKVGQSPIELSREINGFVVNRLQSALLGEAFRLVEDGICSVADVDKAMSDGLGLRWFFMGPFETIDLNAQNGVAEYCKNLGPMYFGLAKEQADPREWGPALVSQVEDQLRQGTAAENLPERRAWRDRFLAGVVAAKRQVTQEQGG